MTARTGPPRWRPEPTGRPVEVVAINAEPDASTSTRRWFHPHDGLREAVRQHGADLGIAHDGDADRCLAVDADAVGRRPDHGGPLPWRCRSGELADSTLVATVMSNLGLHLAMREHGIKVRTTAVGTATLEELRVLTYSLGGEQSGHYQKLPASPPPVMVCHCAALDGRVRETASLASLAQVMRRLPQVLVNVPVV